jgi:hypothetical protein
LQIQLFDQFFLDLRTYFLFGGEADFFDGQDTRRWEVSFTDPYDPDTFDTDQLDGDNLSYEAEPRNSTTDMLIVQLGAAIYF